jgi:GMP synthase (glutamine-hydrolysing)
VIFRFYTIIFSLTSVYHSDKLILQSMTQGEIRPNTEESHRITTTDDIELNTYLGIAKGITGQQPLSKEAKPDAEQEAIVVLDFGSQYSMLITRRIRESHVYCALMPWDTPWGKIAELHPKGFIFSGGPSSVYDEGAPSAPDYIYESHLPILGICYGMQVITNQLGGKVNKGSKKEYGHAILHISDSDSPLFADLPSTTPVWMSHGDKIDEMPLGFRALAYTENSPIAVMGNDKGIYGLQFHPEVVHTPDGKTILHNFVYKVCGCKGTWTVGNFITENINLYIC